MLKTPLRLYINPILDIIAGSRGDAKAPIELEPGVLLIGHFSLDMLVWGGNQPEGLSYEESHHMAYPWLGEGLPTYGVCDTPEQFLERFRGRLADDPRTFCMSFTHIPKDPTNKGQGGGWRWHKWGPYIGDGEPTTEYLDDEPGFVQGVFVYHVLQIDGPKIEDPELARFKARAESKIITKEWVDVVAPKHGRTSCNDDDLSNALGGWNGKYNRDTGKKEIEYPRCNRCYLLNHLGQNVEDLEFAVETSLWWKGQ